MRTALLSVLLCAMALVLPGFSAPVPAANNGRYINRTLSGSTISGATLPPAPPEYDNAVHSFSARGDTVSTAGAVGTVVAATTATAIAAGVIQYKVVADHVDTSEDRVRKIYHAHKQTLDAIETARDKGDSRQVESAVKEGLESLRRVMRPEIFLDH